MWTDRPSALKDGIIAASAVSLVLLAILTIKNASEGNSLLVPSCQEVVADVEKKGNILAQCPAGTYVEIDDNSNVICRCGRRSLMFTREPSLMFNDPMPTEPTIPAPFRPRDDKGTEL